jgi:FkbM family methyltransferase
MERSRRAARRVLNLAADRWRSALWGHLDPSWELESGVVVRVRSRAEWYVYNDLFVDGEYDVAIDALVQSGASDPVVLDLGANVGYFGCRLADRWRRTRGADAPFRSVGIEGASGPFGELRRRLDQPALRGRCTVHHGLVGRRAGDARMLTTAYHIGNAIVREDGRRPRLLSIPGMTERSSFVDVETLVPRDAPIALLKCDIEGAEETFLETYPDLLARVERAVLELHTGECDAERCVRLLAEAGLTERRTLRTMVGLRVDYVTRGM